MANIYGARKYNDHGRYMSILSLKGEVISVIMVPELASNAGWRYIAFKSESFIKCSHQPHTKVPPRLTNKDYPFAKVAKDSKWQTEPSRDDMVDSKVLLGICLTGYFVCFDSPTLSEVRRWSSSVWRKIFEANICDMAVNLFLFEFPNSNMAEQIMQGEWVWKNSTVRLEWWSHFVGCAPLQQKETSTWIGAVGLLLHLWSHDTFWELGEKCEEDRRRTELKNHLKSFCCGSQYT